MRLTGLPAMDLASFLSDELQAARECLAVAGNATLQSSDERRDEITRFVAILSALHRTMERAILPAVRAQGGLSPGVQAAWADLRAVAEAAGRLAEAREGAASPGPGDLVDRFESMVARHETDVVPAIRRLRPETLVALTDRVRTVRLGRDGDG